MSICIYPYPKIYQWQYTHTTVVKTQFHTTYWKLEVYRKLLFTFHYTTTTDWLTHSYILHHNCLPFKFVKEPNWSLHIWTTTSHQSIMKSGAYHTQTNNYKLVTRSSSNCPKPRDILLTLWGWRTMLPLYDTLDIKVLHLLINLQDFIPKKIRGDQTLLANSYTP